MWQFFEFEADFVESLRCIPMQVRYKLDTCGVKLKLQHWLNFNETERQMLIAIPCDRPAEITHYRETLRSLVFAKFQIYPQDLAIAPAPDWFSDQIPETVMVHIQSLSLGSNPQLINLNQWLYLSPLQKFALIKLSTSNHENSNFLPALQEFGFANSRMKCNT